MLKILFQSIPSILFEPIAAGGGLGLATAAVLFWRKKTAWYWSVAFALLFMISWRVAIQIVSSRYASILVFPATIATAYFAFKMDWLAGFIPKFPEWLRKSLPYLTVIGIAIGGIGQLLHYNPYADRILKVAELVKADAQSSGKCCIVAQDSRRLHYYSGLPTEPIISHHTREYSYWQKVSKALQNGFKENPDTVYIVVPEFSKDPQLFSRDGMPEIIRKETVFLKEFYHSRKKKRVTRVYRCNWKNVIAQTLRPYSGSTLTKPAHTIIFRGTIDENSQAFLNEVKFFSERRANSQLPEVNGLPGRWRLAWCPGFELGSNGEVGLVTLADKKNVACHFNKQRALPTSKPSASAAHQQ